MARPVTVDELIRALAKFHPTARVCVESMPGEITGAFPSGLDRVVLITPTPPPGWCPICSEATA